MSVWGRICVSNVGENLRKYRLERGMSQAELAQRAGRKRSAIGNYESGVREPDYDTLAALARALDVSVAQLLDDGEDEALWELREDLRRDPDRRILFSLARHGTDQQVRQAVALIDALKKTNPDFYDGDEPC